MGVNSESVHMPECILNGICDFLFLSSQELVLSEVKNGPAQVPQVNWQNYGNIHYDFPKDSPPLMPLKPGNLKQQVAKV